MKRRRIWTEFLPPEILGAPETVALLRRYQLQPLIAMPPEREGPEMARALVALRDSGVSIGLWPLLDDSEGYWPGAGNAEGATRRVRELLHFAQETGVEVATVAMDLEPSLELKRQMLDATGWERLSYLRRRLRETAGAGELAGYRRARNQYAVLAAELRRAGVESLAIAVPPLAVDRAAGTELWQALFATPLTGPGWDTQSPMFYRSMIQESLPWQSPGWARAIFAEACRLWGETDSAVCMSLGVVGPGKLADEASYDSPSELAWDVACATAQGIGDLALFSLESVYARPDPGAWLDAFTCRPARPSPPVRERLRRKGLRGLLSIAAFMTRSMEETRRLQQLLQPASCGGQDSDDGKAVLRPR